MAVSCKFYKIYFSNNLCHLIVNLSIFMLNKNQKQINFNCVTRKLNVLLEALDVTASRRPTAKVLRENVRRVTEGVIFEGEGL